MSASEQSIPLCVECNGAITPTDLLHESVLALMRSRFWQTFCIPIWLLGGRAALKSKLADVTDLNWDVMPINQEVVDYVREARAEGRAAFLVTASDGRFARGFADRLKIFDEVIVSDEVSNSTGPWKSAVLHERFGLRGYDFVGSSARDLPVWRGARKSILVTNSDRLIRRAKSVANVDKVIRISPPTRLDYLRMMRLHQWLKNILVFLPAVAAHQIGRSPVFLRALLAFFAFGLCASSVYLLNDMLDLETDRQHPRKRNRALASARIPIARAAAFIPVLLCASIAIALELPKTFVAIILGYFSITLSYSVILKRQVIVDVIMLAGLYTTRVVGGAAATNIQPSFWLLAFSMFIF